MAHSDDFWAFVTERDRVWRRREVERLPEPWTEDPTMARYHWTNVHRAKDPGTRWVMRWLERYPDLEDQLFYVYCYRSLNRVATFERHSMPDRDEVSVGRWVWELDAARDAGEALGSRRHVTYYARLRRQLPRLVSAPDLVEAVARARTGFDVIRALAGARLDVGPFLGTQVLADLVTAGSRELTVDRHVEVPVSGGSRFGLRIATGTLSPEEAERGAYDERTTVGRRSRNLTDDPEERRLFRRLLAEQPTSLSEPLTSIDLEHSLCEYSRYYRIRAGDLTRATWLARD